MRLTELGKVFKMVLNFGVYECSKENSLVIVEAVCGEVHAYH